MPGLHALRLVLTVMVAVHADFNLRQISYWAGLSVCLSGVSALDAALDLAGLA